MPSTERVGIIIQARMDSKRLPGKALIDLEGKPLLRRLCDRMTLCRKANDLVVATSDKPQDDAIEEACGSWKIPVYRGPEKDLTARFLGAVNARKLSAFVRVTGDNPLTDPAGVDDLIEEFLGSRQQNGSAVKIVHNSHRGGYPYGTGAELAARSVLEECDRELQSASDRECFMSFARSCPERFPCMKIPAPTHLLRPQYFMTVDHAEDLDVHREIYHHFYGRDDMTLEEIVDFLDGNPELTKLNSRLHEAFTE
ncbi:MAG: NTP transferase domain-containing protein [Candidatus Acidiferrales bacterium]